MADKRDRNADERMGAETDEQLRGRAMDEEEDEFDEVTEDQDDDLDEDIDDENL